MNKNVKRISKDQLVEMVTNITKQVIKESVFSVPEVGAEEYEQQQDFLKNNPGLPMDKPLNEPMDAPMNDPMGTNGDEQFYDDFLSNPAEQSFPTEEPEAMGEDEIDLDSLLENKEEEDLVEKQDKLLNFITENWDHHANNLIK